MKFKNTTQTQYATENANNLSYKHLTQLNRSWDKGTIAPQFARSEWFWCEWKIALNPPFLNGDSKQNQLLNSPLCKRGARGDSMNRDQSIETLQQKSQTTLPGTAQKYD